MTNAIKYLYTTIFFAFCFLISDVFALPTNQELYEAGNKYYMSQQYQNAIEKYELLIKDNVKSYELYFNLGNAYYKTGNFAASILNYERAKKIKSNDEDLIMNLALANQNTVDKIEPAPKVFYEKWWDDYLQEQTADKRSLIGIGLIWLAVIIGCIYIFSRNFSIKRASFFISFIVLFSGLFFIYVASKQNASDSASQEALIYKPSAYVKGSPDEKGTNLFMLHAGTKIEVIDELQGWKKIRIPNGNVGWVQSTDVEII